MALPDPERALEDEAPAQPGARAGEPRGEDDEKVRSVAREAGERAGRAAEGLRDPLGAAVAGRERAQALRADARLALLGHDHVLLAARAPEPTRDRAAVPARADHDPGVDGAGVARDLDAARDGAHLAHPRALVHLD